MTYSDAAPSGTHAGTSFPVLYRGGSAFALHGSTTWLQVIFMMILAAGTLSVIIWRGPIRLHR